jgi:hypothetical protein
MKKRDENRSVAFRKTSQPVDPSTTDWKILLLHTLCCNRIAARMNRVAAVLLLVLASACLNVPGASADDEVEHNGHFNKNFLQSIL